MILTVREVISVPSDCYLERTPDQVRGATEFLPDLLDKAVKEKLALLKIHRHPGGLKQFSSFDIDSTRNHTDWYVHSP